MTYYAGYEASYDVNLLFIVFHKINGYIKNNHNENKYLTGTSFLLIKLTKRY